MLNFYLRLLLVAAVFSFGLCEGRSSSNLRGECHQIERKALLEFKSNLNDPYKRLPSWTHFNHNCCTWYGVFCDNVTGYVLKLNLFLDPMNDFFFGEISPSLVQLKHLRYLDLRHSEFGAIPEFLGSMESLRYLDLLGSGRKIPHQLGNLSNLQHLSLGWGRSNTGLYTENLQWLSGLSSLKFLELVVVKLGPRSNWLKEVSTLPSLKELHINQCNFLNQTTMSPLINSNFSSLSILDLSSNSLNESSVLSWILNLTSLKELYLSFNNFSSSITNWLYRLDQLEVLDLSQAGLWGEIPKSFKKFCNLTILMLYQVKLRQQVNEVFEILHGCASKSLEYLDMRQCQLSGHLSNDILGQFKSLKTLFLSDNNINGTLPQSLGGLAKLEEVHFSGNMLAGEVVELHFVNLIHLTWFNASGNQLVLRVASDWIPPFQQMTGLYLESWFIGPQFPIWLSSLKFLEELDLSNCGILGTIPSWFWTFSTHLYHLNLSHNKIEGSFPNNSNATFLSSLQILDLNTNHFKGPIPSLPSSLMRYLDLSNNSFFGSLSNFLCFKMLGNDTTYSLQHLNMEGNHLEGTIPNCWMNWGGLETINLSNNNFSGLIPESLGTLSFLLILHLQNNKLSGGIPLSLRNCTKLSSLNLATNLLTGSIAKWVGEALPNLAILILRGNKFQGNMPKELCRLASLRILDLANNNISGSIPNCINEFHAMTVSVIDPAYTSPFYVYMGVDYDHFIIENDLLVTKGREQEYDKILEYVKIIDLSNNNFSGEIPIEITSLYGLEFLNLSNNHLVGKIPQDIDELKWLESLDLSKNHLSGNIPQSMATLNFLSYLNLSNNNLIGRIPLGTQLQSFDAFSYSGNDGLCGAPLPNNCSENGQAYRKNVDGGCDIDWFYVSMALGFVVGLWGVVGSLIFIREWRYEFFNFLDYLGSKIYGGF